MRVNVSWIFQQFADTSAILEVQFARDWDWGWTLVFSPFADLKGRMAEILKFMREKTFVGRLLSHWSHCFSVFMQRSLVFRCAAGRKNCKQLYCSGLKCFHPKELIFKKMKDQYDFFLLVSVQVCSNICPENATNFNQKKFCSQTGDKKRMRVTQLKLSFKWIRVTESHHKWLPQRDRTNIKLLLA